MVKPICPHCEVSLRRRWNKKVFQYFCPSCFGFAVHFGGLKFLLEPGYVKELWSIAQKAPESETKCSHCRRPMQIVYQGEGQGIELDICKRCDLVWLDTGEWADLTGTVPRASTPAVYKEYAKALLEMEKAKEEAKTTFEINQVKGSDLPVWKAVAALLGLPVEEKEDRFHTVPWVTWLVMTLCVLISSLAFRDLDFAAAVFGHSAENPFPFNMVSALTSFFLHGGIFHLVSNMYFLWIFGDNIEDHLGKTKYLWLLISATWLGAFTWAFWDPNASEIPAVGASGGVSGLVAYYLIRFPHRRFVFFFFFRWVAVPGLMFGGLFFLKEFLGALGEMSGAGGSVAHLAHLGGAFAGVLFAILFSPKNTQRDLP